MRPVTLKFNLCVDICLAMEVQHCILILPMGCSRSHLGTC